LLFPAVKGAMVNESLSELTNFSAYAIKWIKAQKEKSSYKKQRPI
jgi:hypothetical protein